MPPLNEIVHLAHVEIRTPCRTATPTTGPRAKGQAWGLKTIPSFHAHGTPPVEVLP